MQVKEPEYWQLIKEGNKQTFELVFRSYYQPLCNYARPIIKDPDEAEEVVQNVFYNIWNKRETLEISVSLKAYLYRAVQNDCLNRIKHGKVRAVYASDYQSMMNGAAYKGTAALEGKELQAQIDLAIDSLPEQCGIVFRMSRFEFLKYNEIAEKLNISVKTVENHMGKALRLLRERLKDYLPLLAWLFWIN